MKVIDTRHFHSREKVNRTGQEGNLARSCGQAGKNKQKLASCGEENIKYQS